MALVWLILLPLLMAVLAPPLVRVMGGRGTGWWFSLVPLGIAGWLLARAGQGGGVLEWSHAWLPSMGVDLALRLDGMSLLFALLVSFIGGLICIYGGAYLEGDRQLPRFFSVLFLFMASMLGVIVADDVILTFVFWELTSITSFLLVGYKHYDEKARKAALQALLVTGGGGLALLAGLILVTQITGSTRISEFPAHAALLGESRLFPAALVLILLGVFTKSAQVPFHFWLPGAMAAPTPVSAYLHSATMVKAGVILLAKLAPAMSHTALWTWLVVPVGAATMLTGALMAVFQTDLKRLLAYSTVSVLGTLVMLIGLGDSFSLKTALFLALVHGLYKGSLFMVAGTVDHAAGTREVTLLDGLARSMPLLAVAAGLAAMSMSGVPPTLGFISKELLYETKLDQGTARHLLTAAGVLANALGVAVALIVGVRPFVSKGGTTRLHHPPGPGMVVPPLVLAGLGLLLGLAPGLSDRWLISPGAAALGADPSLAKLTLWHGFTPVLALSGLTLVLGAGFFRWRLRLRAAAGALGGLGGMTPTAIYEFLLDGVLRGAKFLTNWIQNGQLRVYVRVTLAAGTVLILYAVARSTGKFETNTRVPAGAFDTAVVLVMCVAAGAAVVARSRLTAILCLGGVGYSVVLLFVAFGAPDLAITQLLVETLTVVMFSFVILKLPQIRYITRRGERQWDGLVAVLAGLAMTLVVWKSMHIQVHDPISPGMVERSATEAYGRNVVNVTLVDFRALDTLGEILVLSLACLGVTALLARQRVVRRPAASGGASERAVAKPSSNPPDPR
jgi:multicomponent Na+:H+ antiporter subunit A